ncbi:MAG: DUF6804 family protein [bacterium]
MEEPKQLPKVAILVPALVAAAMCLVALGNNPYSYYQTLRLVVCGVSTFLAWAAHREGKEGWSVALGMVAVIFNPIIPIHLSRSIWAVIDLATAGVLLVAGFKRFPGKNLADR